MSTIKCPHCNTEGFLDYWWEKGPYGSWPYKKSLEGLAIVKDLKRIGLKTPCCNKYVEVYLNKSYMIYKVVKHNGIP